MEVVFYFIVGSFSIIFLYFYRNLREKYSLWKRKAVKHPEPNYLIGNSKLSKLAPGELQTELYEKYNHDKFIGYYEFSIPILMIMDPTMIQNILIKDFAHFTDRGSSSRISREMDNSNAGIFFMKGHKWKALRNRLSPTFTTGKLKGMFECMIECCRNVDGFVSNKHGRVDARELMFSYTIDMIAACAFGLDINRNSQTAEEFREKGMKAMRPNFIKSTGTILLAIFPFLSKFINIPIIDKDTIGYFIKVFAEALKFRRETGYERKDFLQLLIQLKDKGSVDFHSIEPDDQYLNITKPATSEKFEFTETMVYAQAFTFITAGMEPSGNTLTFALCELAYRPNIQNRLRQEVNNALEKHKNQFTYEAVKNMDYLDHFILETLRLYPVSKTIRRICTKKYRLNDSVTLDVGTQVTVPAKSIHLDGRYFAVPLEFNPDRFINPSHPPCTFFPFGEGPRICIGMRFAMVEMKVILAKIVVKYTVRQGDQFKYPIPLNKWSLFHVPSKPVNIILEKI